MPTFNFKDSDGRDIGDKYVTKDYLMDVYPDLVPAVASPQLWMWGRGSYGRLGDGTAVAKSSPVTTAGTLSNWKELYVGMQNACGVKSDGTAWTWGVNGSGQLGDGTTVSKSSPVTLAGGGTNWKQIGVGQVHGAGVKTDGTLWTWGSDSYGAQGTNGGGARSSPGQLGTATNWKLVAVGNFYAGAIKIDGTLWMWGAGNSGRLGDGTAVTKSSPVTTAGGGTNWKQLALEKEGGAVAAIKTDGTLWTWGENNNGKLGDGTTTNRSSPVQTSGAGTTWKQASINYSSTAAIKTDGTLWTWGAGTYGALGNNSTADRSSPQTPVGGGTDWKTVAVGRLHMLAIKTDGSLWTWGRNNQGQLGIGTTTDRSSPGSTTYVGNYWKSISASVEASGGISEQGGW
jgi:alpha-tubulin suppressor-like RCC1 family protein